MGGKPIKHVTPGRAAWLRRLSEEGPAISHSPVGFACRSFGWSEWLVERAGERVPISEAQARYPGFAAMWSDGWKYTGLEMVTEAGRAALKASENPNG